MVVIETATMVYSRTVVTQRERGGVPNSSHHLHEPLLNFDLVTPNP